MDTAPIRLIGGLLAACQSCPEVRASCTVRPICSLQVPSKRTSRVKAQLLHRFGKVSVGFKPLILSTRKLPECKVCKTPRFQDASRCTVQPNRSLQVPLTQKPCLKAAASSPFRKGSAMAGVGLSLNALKLSACKLPECKSLQCPALQRKSRPAWKLLRKQSEKRQVDVFYRCACRLLTFATDRSSKTLRAAFRYCAFICRAPSHWRHVRPLPVVLFKQPKRSLQVLSMQKLCLKAAASLPFRRGNATVVARVSLNVLKLSGCKLPE